MSKPSEHLPPLRAWPPSAYEGEPAHGFFVRMAHRNSARSTRALAATLGLNGKDFDLPQLLEFCLEHPFQGQDRLIDATPRVGSKLVILNGETFRRHSDWSLERPRVCTACLGESVYYRNWWDLTIIGRCPIHDRPLVRGPADAQLTWVHPDLSTAADGSSLVEKGVARLHIPTKTWDAYVLGRLGVIDKKPVPALDTCEMRDVVEAVALVGRAAMQGWASNAPPVFSKYSEERYSSLCAGFAAFSEGVRAIADVVRRYLDTTPPEEHSGAEQNVLGRLGWLYPVASELRQSDARADIFAAIMIVANGCKINLRPGSRRRIVGPIGLVSLGKLAPTLKMGPRRLRELVVLLGIKSDRAGKGAYVYFDDEEVAKITAIVADLVSPNQARSLLGVSPLMFKAIHRDGLLTPLFHQGTAAAKFRRSEVERLLFDVETVSVTLPAGEAKIDLAIYCRNTRQSVAKVLRRVMAGELILDWQNTGNGLQNCSIAL